MVKLVGYYYSMNEFLPICVGGVLLRCRDGHMDAMVTLILLATG